MERYIIGALFGSLVTYILQQRTQYREINKTLKTMSQQFDDLKAKLQKQSDTITNVAADVKFLKDKLAQGTEGGLTAEEVTELAAVIDGTNASLEELDAETDSSTTDNGGDVEGDQPSDDQGDPA